jgi:hypothetical protein
LWVGYKKKAIEKSLSSATDTNEESSESFFFSALGRGGKYF